MKRIIKNCFNREFLLVIATCYRLRFGKINLLDERNEMDLDFQIRSNQAPIVKLLPSQYKIDEPINRRGGNQNHLSNENKEINTINEIKPESNAKAEKRKIISFGRFSELKKMPPKPFQLRMQPELPELSSQFKMESLEEPLVVIVKVLPSTKFKNTK